MKIIKTIDEIHDATKYDKWFLKQIHDLINLEKIVVLINYSTYHI